jgi:hypothetical protein
VTRAPALSDEFGWQEGTFLPQWAYLWQLRCWQLHFWGQSSRVPLWMTQ